MVETLSNNYTISELTRSDTAKKLGISNIPTTAHIANLQNLCICILEPILQHFSGKVYISSGYRSDALNKAMKGVKSSAHCTGQAVDLDCDVFAPTGVTNANVFNYIKDNLIFDQLIWEGGDSTNPAWVHVSYTKTNRKQVLRMIRHGKSTIYENY